MSSRIDKNILSRTTRDSRHTPSTGMLHQTPRASDIDNGECTHFVTDAGEMAPVAHVVDGHDPRGGHARPLSACDGLFAAHGRPVHPFSMAAQCGIGIHCFMPRCCTSEDVEIVNVVGWRPKLYQCTRNHQSFNFTHCADIGRASARPQSGPGKFLTLWATHPCSNILQSRAA